MINRRIFFDVISVISLSVIFLLFPSFMSRNYKNDLTIQIHFIISNKSNNFIERFIIIFEMKKKYCIYIYNSASSQKKKD